MELRTLKIIGSALTWGAFTLLVLGTILNWSESEWLAVQQTELFRNVSGVVLFGLMLSQWGLSVGRLVYRASGPRWERWVSVHQLVALTLPIALCVHSLALGYGLLAVLPVLFLTALVLGLRLVGETVMKPWLPMHLVFSGLTLGATLVHIWRVVFYR